MARISPWIGGGVVAVLWAGTAWIAASPGSSTGEPSAPREGEDRAAKEVKHGLKALKGEVLGKDQDVRGRKVIAPSFRPEEEDMNYTRREVCVKMKLDFPDQYKNLDCSKASYNSPDPWNWE